MFGFTGLSRIAIVIRIVFRDYICRLNQALGHSEHDNSDFDST